MRKVIVNTTQKGIRRVPSQDCTSAETDRDPQGRKDSILPVQGLDCRGILHSPYGRSGDIARHIGIAVLHFYDQSEIYESQAGAEK